jgi:hypothetical protein
MAIAHSNDARSRRPFRFDRRHIARNAFAAGAVLLVMRVFFERSRAWPVRRLRAVAIQAKLLRGFAQLRIVCCSVNVVAVKAGDAARVHHTLHEIVALHAVLVQFAVGKSLCLRCAEIGNTRVEIFTKLRAGAAVNSVAGSAVHNEQFSTALYIVCRDVQQTPRTALMPESRNFGFCGRRRLLKR